MSRLNLAGLPTRATDTGWQDLVRWTAWLRATYGDVEDALTDCWPRHPDIVLDLLNMRDWWRWLYAPAVEQPGAGSHRSDGEAADAWRDHLAQAAARWREAVRGCRTGPDACARKNPDRADLVDRRNARSDQVAGDMRARLHELAPAPD